MEVLSTFRNIHGSVNIQLSKGCTYMKCYQHSETFTGVSTFNIQGGVHTCR